MQSRIELLQSKLKQESKKLNLGCEITQENLKDIVIIKKNGQINQKEFATKNNLDYFVSTDLINCLTDYFKDILDEKSDGICCPVSFEELHEEEHPVILCPSIGHVAGTILSHSSGISLARKIDPKNNGSFEKMIDAPIISFLVSHMCALKIEIERQTLLKEQENANKFYAEQNDIQIGKLQKKSIPHDNFFAVKKSYKTFGNHSYSSNYDAEDDVIIHIKNDVLEMLMAYYLRMQGHFPSSRATMASELTRKAQELNTENLSDFIDTMRSMRESIASEYRVREHATQSQLYNGINEILEPYESNRYNYSGY